MAKQPRTEAFPPQVGGARPGAGRKTNLEKGLPQLVKRSIALAPDQLAFVEAMAADRSLTTPETLRAILAEYIARGGWVRRTGG